jgi:hypothetical protein
MRPICLSPFCPKPSPKACSCQALSTNPSRAMLLLASPRSGLAHQSYPAGLASLCWLTAGASINTASATETLPSNWPDHGRKHFAPVCWRMRFSKRCLAGPFAHGRPGLLQAFQLTTVDALAKYPYSALRTSDSIYQVDNNACE